MRLPAKARRVATWIVDVFFAWTFAGTWLGSGVVWFGAPTFVGWAVALGVTAGLTLWFRSRRRQQLTGAEARSPSRSSRVASWRG